MFGVFGPALKYSTTFSHIDGRWNLRTGCASLSPEPAFVNIIGLCGIRVQVLQRIGDASLCQTV
jgi:hypothetical protein